MMTGGIVGTVLLILHIVMGFVAAVAVSVNRRPSATIAWILTIIFIPFLGLVAFLLVGVGRLPRHCREKQLEVNALMLERSNVTNHLSRLEQPAWFGTAVDLNRNLGALPMVSGNRAALLDDYEGTFAAITHDIDQAVEYVHVEFYILVHDDTTADFFAALARATARGVSVRVLSDHVSGFMFPRRKETQRILAEMGATWRPMLPLRPFSGQWQRPDLRNHRKLVVIDGRIGYTGS